MDTTGFLEFLKSKRVIISRKKLICLAVFISLWASISYWSGGWLVYHKPAFRGRVLDSENKHPIVGAVAVVVYTKENFGGPGGKYTTVVKVKETLTDKKGEFMFPAYTTLIQPLSTESYAEFIIYKPGYDTFPGQGTILSGLSIPDIEEFFSKKMGSEGILEVMVKGKKGPDFKMVKVKFGIAELPALKTWKEKEQAWMNADIFSDDIRAKDLPLLYKMIKEASKIRVMSLPQMAP